MAFLPSTLKSSAPVQRPATAPSNVARFEPSFSVELVDSNELGGRVTAWESLVANALEPNCFYEPWMLLPAIEQFGADSSLSFGLVYRTAPSQARQLCGLFPLERRKRFRGIPVRYLTLWQHLHCVLCTPLLHRDHALQTLMALLRWVGADRNGAAVIELPFVSGEGLFAQMLVDAINELRSLTYPVETMTRAFMKPGASGEEYIQEALAPKHRRELQRLRRRLADLGRLETRLLRPDEDVNPWIDQFLALEASGWKGVQRTALACVARERAFFTTVVRRAHACGKLMMLGLFLDDRPLALKCNFRSGPGAFTFKIAFDERFEKYSPGVQLELDNIAAAHHTPGLAWMDSCAIAKHPMINRLWTHRRTIQSVVLSSGAWRGNLLVGLLPMLRALKRTFCRKQGESPCV